MATTNTSDKVHSRFLLRLRDIQTDKCFDLNLYQGRIATGELNIADSVVVHNDHAYSMFLLSSKELTSRYGIVDINGEVEEEVYLNPITNLLHGIENGNWFHYQLIFNREKQNIFSLIFGLAKIRLILEEDESSVSLETLDVACACDKSDYKIIVSDMLDELIGTQDRECFDWMFYPVRFDQEDISVVKSAVVDNSIKNLKSLVELGRMTIRVFRRHLDYFTLHGHCKTTRKEMLDDPSSVRRLGRNELLWLSKNPERLYESKRKTAVLRDGKYYMASRIQTEQIHKSYDNIENRALVSFAGELSRVFSKAISEVESYIDRFKKISDNLNKLDVEGDMLPTLIIVNTCLEKELPVIEEAKSIQREAKIICERLLKAFPDVLEVRYVLPKRTKVFQEILPYAAMHAEMRKWNNFGRIDILRDVLALRTWRIDKLYEYYVLYKMLEELRSLGFEPDGLLEHAFKQYRYTAEEMDKDFRNEKQVANTYLLSRGDEKITLYYQPVFYCDEHEENDIELHRLTNARRHPYWTPDYLIVHKSQQGVTRTVVDAKFRQKRDIHWNNAKNKGNESRMDLTNSAFLDCMLKYKVATGGTGGIQTDSLWILFGRSDRKVFQVYQNSKWAKESFGGISDGIASSSPEVNCIAEMMSIIGIRECHTVKDEQTEQARSASTEKMIANVDSRILDVLSKGSVERSEDVDQIDIVAKLVRELASKIYDKELLFDCRYSQRNLGLPHSIMKKKPASGHEAKLYSSQLVEIDGLYGYIFVKWLPNNLNKLSQLIRKSG